MSALFRYYAREYITPGRVDPLFHVIGGIFVPMFAFECVHHASAHGHEESHGAPAGAGAAAAALPSASSAAAGKTGTVIVVDMDNKTVKVHT